MNFKFNNRGPGLLKIPGLNLPINTWPDKDPTFHQQYKHFEHGLASAKPNRLTAREVCMLNFMNIVTDKPGWDSKILNSSIVAKWRDETRAESLLSDAAFDWCIKELQDKAKDYTRCRYVQVLDNATVCVKSDALVPSSLQSQLQAAVKSLLEQTDKDWHPNSNDQVLNLVHPSLYPLVYGRSRVLSTAAATDLDTSFMNIGRGEVIPEQELAEPESRYPSMGGWNRIAEQDKWSTRFQWLPCEVSFVGDSGTDVHISSYINNLHPRTHADLYPIIEKLISLSIGPWNDMLYRGYDGRLPLRIHTYGAVIENADPSDLDWAIELYDLREMQELEPFQERIQEYIARPNGIHVTAQKQQELEDELRTAGHPDEIMPILEAKQRMIRDVHHPEPGISYTYEQWKEGKDLKPVIETNRNFGMKLTSLNRVHKFQNIAIEEEFRQQGLQIIVKLSSIELNPDRPEYQGGNWHLEGKLNEHIVATAIYYYDVENVTESKIRFRQEASLDDLNLVYEQDDHDPLSMIFGTSGMSFEPAVQEIGSITTSHGRFIAFPNVCQHRVEPFRLTDPTRPGHRRFLVLWLVDPHLRIMSTANVPPQQHAWWAEEVLRAAGNALPGEMMNKIVQEDTGWPMREEEAKRLRLELMAERTTFTTNIEANFGTYNLCEH